LNSQRIILPTLGIRFEPGAILLQFHGKRTNILMSTGIAKPFLHCMHWRPAYHDHRCAFLTQADDVHQMGRGATSPSSDSVGGQRQHSLTHDPYVSVVHGERVK